MNGLVSPARFLCSVGHFHVMRLIPECMGVTGVSQKLTCLQYYQVYREIFINHNRCAARKAGPPGINHQCKIVTPPYLMGLLEIPVPVGDRGLAHRPPNHNSPTSSRLFLASLLHGRPGITHHPVSLLQHTFRHWFMLPWFVTCFLHPTWRCITSLQKGVLSRYRGKACHRLKSNVSM